MSLTIEQPNHVKTKQQLNQVEENLNQNLSNSKIYFNKMVLPNDNFTSFHDKLLKTKDYLKNDCSRSFDILTFKNRKQTVINLNHNLITLNTSLFINDQLNDSLQWCLEPDFQNENYYTKNIINNSPKNSSFENELSNDLYANSSFESKKDVHQNSIELTTSRNFHHPNQNYELLSRKLDVNLAQLDIETFSRLDMNNLLNEINNKFSSSEEVGANEQLIDNCSVDDSLISEINERTNALRLELNASRLSLTKPVLNSSFTLNSKLDENIDDHHHQHHRSNEAAINLESVGISVDSLDNSCFEQKCAEVVDRCKKPDKSKYTLAFEQLDDDDSMTESLFKYIQMDFENDLQNRVNLNDDKERQFYERYLNRLKHNEIHLNKVFNDLNRKRLNDKRLNSNDKSTDKLSRSEYSTTNSYERQSSHKNSTNDLNNVSKLTKSLQNDLIDDHLMNQNSTMNSSQNYYLNDLSKQLSNSKNYVPLFNLNNSFNSGGSSCSMNSAPKSLIKLFIQNKNSSLSSSLESQSNLISSGQNQNDHHQQQQGNLSENTNQNQNNNYKNSSSSSSQMNEQKQIAEQMNRKNYRSNYFVEKSNSTEKADQQQKNQCSPENLYTANTLNINNNSNQKNLKMFHNRKTSPIREEEDETTTTKEVKKYTSFQNVTAMCRNRIDTKVDQRIEEDKKINDFQKINCPRSISMNEIGGGSNKQRSNLIKQYSLQKQQQQQNNTQSNNCASNKPKECSISSGYLSSGSNNNTFENKNKQFQQRAIFQQHQPIYEDKQVQTSIYEQQCSTFYHQQQPQQSQQQQQPKPILINELPRCSNSNNTCCNNSTHNNSPIYVYYPNYSLPDLNFINSSFQNIHLSPTKFQAPSFDSNGSSSSSTVTNFKRKRRISSSKIPQKVKTNNTRPKSCGDFEKLTKESFKHIQDWESLKTLLPDDIKELIRTLNLQSDNDESDDVLMMSCNGKIKSKTTSNTPTTNKSFQMAIIGNYLSNNNVDQSNVANSTTTFKNQSIKLRQKMFSFPSKQNNKRHSLQEPPMHLDNDDCMLNCSCGNTHSGASSYTINSRLPQRRGMIKSATMNMPIIIQQQQKQQQMQIEMHSKMYCQTPCHSCCSLNQLNLCHQINSCCSSCHCSTNGNHFGTFSGQQCMTQQQHHYNQCRYQMNNYCMKNDYVQFGKISPNKPYNPITEEQNEDTDYESLDYLMENGNKNGELDFDKLLNLKNVDNKKGKNQVGFKSKLINGRENFNDLKNHWENVASKQAKSNPTTPITSSTAKRPVKSQQQQQKQKIINNQSVRAAATKTPQNKSKVNNRRSRSKSPEKSNKEVVILTKKQNNKSQATTALKSTKNSAATKAKSIERASQQPQQQQVNNSRIALNQTAVIKRPIRPSSFNTQFKSMIPVPKASNRSPPLK